MPRPWVAETPTGSPRPRRVELGGQRLVGGPVDLVRDDDHRHVGAAQDLGDLGVALAQAGAGVEHERDGVGVGDRLARLVLDRARERVLGREVDAAGVDELEPDPVPLALERLAVAGDPGLLVDDRLAPAGEPVDERRLADVGKADDRDSRRAAVAHHASPRSRASSATRSTTSSTLEPGGVDLDRVVGRPQRAVLALAVARVALGLRREHLARRLARSRAARRRARSSSVAVRKTFSGASGLTTVPMSRPSAT